MSPRLFVSRLSQATRRRIGLSACILGNLLMLSGCAKQPPTSALPASFSGKRLRVTLQFRNAVDPRYFYFFLINYVKGTDTSSTAPGGGVRDANGPVAIFQPLSINGQTTYGNGFATGINQTGGFTDYVEFTANTYSLYHVIGDPLTNQRSIPKQPVSVTIPQGGSHTLQFDLDLSQIVLNSDGSSLDATDTVNIAQNVLRYLQVNIVATDIVPVGATAAGPLAKQVDSLGNTFDANGRVSWLILDMTQVAPYTNESAVGSAVEPSTPDILTLNGDQEDDALDLVDYSIQVIQQQ